VIFEGRSYVGHDFGDADLRGMTFVGCDFSRADLSRADLANARIERCTMKGARLDGANLHRVAIVGCDWTGAEVIVIEPSAATDGHTVVLTPSQVWFGCGRMTYADLMAAPDRAFAVIDGAEGIRRARRWRPALLALARGQGWADDVTPRIQRAHDHQP